MTSRDHQGSPLALGAAIGAIVGARSMSGPAVLGVAGALRPAPPSQGRSPRLAASLLSAMAAGEMAADKHPRIPARTSPLPWAARIVVGGACGAAVAARSERPVLGAAVAGALAAAIAARVAYRARARLAQRFPQGSPIPGLIEDALVVAAGAALVRALVRA